MNRVIFIYLLLILTTVCPVQSGTSAAIRQQDQSLMLYSKGRNMMLDGDYQQAIAVFQNLLDTYPESSRAAESHFYIGYSHEVLRQHEKAWLQYRYILENYDNSKGAYRRAIERASILARQINHQSSREIIETLQSYMNRNKSLSEEKVVAAVNLARAGNLSGKWILLSGLENATPPVQVRISELLSKFPQDEQIIGAMATILQRKDSHPLVQVNAVKTLSAHPDHSRYRPILIKTLEETDYEIVRASAAEALLPLAEDEKVAAALMSFLAKSSNPVIINSLGKRLKQRNNGDQFTAVLHERLAHETDPRMKFTLSQMLENHIPEKERIIVLRELSQSPSVEIRIHAVREMQKKEGSPEIKLEFIRAIETDPNTQVKIAALNGLKDELDDKEVRHVLIRSIQNSDDPVWITSTAHILSRKLSDPRVRESLVKKFRSVNDPFVADQLSSKLMHIIGDQEVQTAILDVLNSPQNIYEIKLNVLNNLTPEAVRLLGNELEKVIRAQPDAALKNAYQRITAELQQR